MARPQIQITNLTSTFGNLPTDDGVCLLVHNAPSGYTISTNEFNSLEEAEQAGVTSNMDTMYNYLLWEHVKDFYTQVPNGKLFLHQTSATSLVQLFTPGSAPNTALKNFLSSKQGLIKIVGVTFVPATETHTSSISPDLEDAIPLAQAFSQSEYTRLRPIEIIFEGRKFSGTASAALDLRALNSGNVSVVIARRSNPAFPPAMYNNYAQIGLFLGSLAKIHVGRNVGRVASGALVGVNKSTLSGGQVPYETLSETDLDVLSDKGYIFMDTYPGRVGWFWVDDHTCTLPNRSDAYISYNRVAHKAARIAVRTYVERLKDEVPVNKTTGKLPLIVVQSLQNELQKAIESEMISNPDPTREKEISGVSVTIDPNQNVLATGKIVAQLKVVPLGIARIIETQVQLINPAS